MSSNCSACFGVVCPSIMRSSYHCIYSIWHYWDRYCYLSWASRSRQVAVTVSIMPDTVETVIWAPDDGWRYHPNNIEQFADINKPYIVASCWIIIDTYYAMHGPLNIKSYENLSDLFSFGELIEIINKPLLLHLVGYLYYWQMGFNSVFKGLSMRKNCRAFNIMRGDIPYLE